MTRTRVRRRRRAVGVGLAAVLCLLAWSNVVAAGAQQTRGIAEARPQQAYVVREGDTLWSIASRIGAGRDPRLVVDAIARANGIAGATVVPGEALVIPTDLS